MMKTRMIAGSEGLATGPVRRSSGAALVSVMSLGLAGLLSLGGCNKAPAPAAEPATSAAPAPSTSTPPATSAAPAASAPAAQAAPPPAAAAAPPPPPSAAAPAPRPEPVEYTVPAGTRVVVRIQQTITAKDSNVGDSFSGTLAQSVVVKGVNLIRAGAPVTGTVTAAKGQGRFKGAGDLGIAVNRIGNYQVTTSSYEAVAKGKGKRTAGFIGGGGGGGALIGGLAGGGKGALIGGLLGAGAGTAGAVFTGNKNITIPAESVVTFSLTNSFRVTKER